MKNHQIEIELRLIHDGNCWFAENDLFKMNAPSLSELENKIKDYLTHEFQKHRGKELSVLMYYDFDSFPKWLRQYHSHYFNRVLTFTL